MVELTIVLFAKFWVNGNQDELLYDSLETLEIPSREGVRQVMVELAVSGLSDGQRAAHIHERDTR
jgi:hypothetical protein